MLCNIADVCNQMYSEKNFFVSVLIVPINQILKQKFKGSKWGGVDDWSVPDLESLSLQK